MPRPIADVDSDLQTVKGRIADIDRDTALVEQRLDTVQRLGKEVYENHRETARKVDDLRRESERELAVLRHQIEENKRELAELKKDRDKWEQRFWMFVIPLSVLVLGALILAAIGLKKP